jgi:hypothetical protein
MRRVRFTTLALGLLVSITVVPALPASASDDDRNRCTRVKVATHPVMWDRPQDWSRSIFVSGPDRRNCEPGQGLAVRAAGRLVFRQPGLKVGPEVAPGSASSPDGRLSFNEA